MKWFPERMSEVEIEIPDHYARKVTELLADKGLLHMEDISYLNVEQGETQGIDWQLRASEFANLEKQLIDTMLSLDIKTGEPPDEHIKMITEPDQLQPFADQIEKEVNETSQLLTESQKKIEQLETYITLLSPLIDINISIDHIRNRRYIYTILGSMPTEKIERFKTSMANTPFALLVLKQERDRSIILLIGSRQNKDYLRRAARSAYLTGIDLPDHYQGTPHEIIDKIKDEVETYQNQIGLRAQEMEKIRKTRAQRLQEVYWHVRYSRLMTEALMHYNKLRHGYLVAGWVPSNKLEELGADLKAISHEIIIDVKDEDNEKEVQNVPVILQKTGFQRGFQKLVTTFGLPTYNELDPTLLMMLTFPLIFGSMFGDIGHGLILIIVGLLLASNKIKKLARFTSFGTVVFLCGLVATIFGFLYGSIFGMEDILPALWQHPMENIMSLLLIAAGGGVVLLTIANILALINDIHNRDWFHFFLDSKGLPGLFLYWSLLGLILSLVIEDFFIHTTFFIVCGLTSALMIFLSGYLKRRIKGQKPYLEGGPFVYFIQAFFELFETVIGYLSNSLSYVRIGAFAVAHVGLSAVFFILAELVNPAKGLGYWLVVVLGNLFVIGFEGMIVSIQTLRLEYYEFFSKFFSGGGRRYRPFRLHKSNKEGAK